MGELPKTMKALVAYGLGDYRLELDYPVPECGPDDIIIKTEACGICAGDLKCMHGAAMFPAAPAASANPAATGCASPTPSSDFRAETTGEWRNTSVIPKTR